MTNQNSWRCSICGNKTSFSIHTVKEMMFGLRETFEYVECGNCQCLIIKEVPNDLFKYYPSDYYSFTQNSISNKGNNPLVGWRNKYIVFGKPLIGKLLLNLFPKNEVRWVSLLGLKKETSVLDVGCGSGNLLYFLRDQGMTRLTGIDPYLPEDLISSEELSILKKDIFSINGLWDIISFNHVFEHMESPVEVLKKTSNLLTEKGQCIISIPTVTGLAWDEYGTDWVQIDAPRHLFLHSEKSIDILAERTGFTVSNIIYNSTGFQFWGSEQNRKGISLINKKTGTISPDSNLFTKEELNLYEKRAKLLNKNQQGDQAIFFLRKKQT